MDKTRKLTKIAMLLSMALVLSFLEGAIVIAMTMPVGIKLGLSNIAVVVCFCYLGVKEAYGIMFCKSIFVLVTRGFTSFLMSISGGIVSLTLMIILYKLLKVKDNLLLISVVGAISHNIGQVIMATIILNNFYTVYYLPILLVSGVVVGVTTGLIMTKLLPRLKKIGL